MDHGWIDGCIFHVVAVPMRQMLFSTAYAVYGFSFQALQGLIQSSTHEMGLVSLHLSWVSSSVSPMYYLVQVPRLPVMYRESELRTVPFLGRLFHDT